MKTSFSLLLTALLLISSQAYAERQQRPERGAQERQQRQDSGSGAGHLSREQRKELHQDVNDLSKDIYREKPNAERRSRSRDR